MTAYKFQSQSDILSISFYYLWIFIIFNNLKIVFITDLTRVQLVPAETKIKSYPLFLRVKIDIRCGINCSY
jgi:hypothetical protein